MTPTVYLLHGRDSSPLSVKIQHLSALATAHGWRVVAPDFSTTVDPDLRVRLFLEIAEKGCGKNIIVGSSMGGYVALQASKTVKPDALLLLAPALNLPGYAELNPQPVAGETTIIQGWSDDVINPESVFEFANRYRSTLHLVNDDHALHQSLPFIETVFSAMLNRCRPVSRLERITASL